MPEHPYPGQSWREIRHDKTVTWLAFWKGAHLLRSGRVCLIQGMLLLPETRRQLIEGQLSQSRHLGVLVPSAHCADALWNGSAKWTAQIHQDIKNSRKAREPCCADPISEKDYKYVWLAANSQFKSESDLQKYEKARKLKACARPSTSGCGVQGLFTRPRYP